MCVYEHAHVIIYYALYVSVLRYDGLMKLFVSIMRAGDLANAFTGIKA